MSCIMMRAMQLWICYQVVKALAKKFRRGNLWATFADILSENLFIRVGSQLDLAIFDQQSHNFSHKITILLTMACQKQWKAEAAPG